MNLDKRIPDCEFPYIMELGEAYIDEPLVCVSDVFYIEPYYYNIGMKGALDNCYVRSGVMEKLLLARSFLPNGLTFKIFDGFRPISVQQHLWDLEYGKQRLLNPNMNEEEIEKKTCLFVSKPSYSPSNPSVHNTGGAVDLTIVTTDGYSLDMGTQFDDFTGMAHTSHFEGYQKFKDVRKKRRILYNAMIQAGFTNLPSEWWHFDYGDKFWAYFTGKPKLYKGMPYINEVLV